MDEAIKLTERQQFWLDHIQAARAAKLPLARYAREHGLKTKDIYQWSAILVRRGALEPRTRSKQLVPVQLHTLGGCSVSFPSGARLELADVVTSETLRELVNALQHTTE